MTIWFATGNAHKKAELVSILRAHRCPGEVLTPGDVGLDFDPEETEDSFHGNALLKARALHRLLREARPPAFAEGDPVIADDSGICVDALGGRPGVYSARYAGPEGNADGVAGGKLGSAERNALLLGEIGDDPVRTARFVCAMILSFGDDRFLLAQETFEGEIVGSPDLAVGHGGFGYDPILFIPGLGRTVAELSEDDKNAISHRGKAARRIAEALCQDSR